MTANTAVVTDPIRNRRRWTISVLAVLAVTTVAASLALGAVALSPSEVVGVFGRRLGLGIGADPSVAADAVVWNIRFPRILIGLVAGAALGASGAVLQGVFRNPLADPQLLGVTPGAALGGVIGSLSGTVVGAIAGGTVGGLLSSAVVRRLGRSTSLEPSRFVLTGVAYSAALTAWVGFIVFAADRAKVPPVEFWLLGTLSGSTWRALGTMAVIVGLGLAALLASSRTLDLLALGESEARHLGVDVDFSVSVIMLAIGVTAGATVGAVGVIGFVGLLVPHLLRPLVGPAHRGLIVSSAIGGAILVAGGDLLARTLISPIEIPVGLITSVIGGPVFVWLIRRSTR